MTVQELIEMLEDMPAEAEVRLAVQPSWPLEYSIGRVVGPDEIEDAAEEGGDADMATRVVYMAEGAQLGYLPGAASNALGWR
jgi:hypothetical protein